MLDLHFDVGDSSHGPVGLCACVRAKTIEAGVARLGELLPEEVEVDLGLDRRRGEYVSVYTNADAITAADVDMIGGDDNDHLLLGHWPEADRPFEPINLDALPVTPPEMYAVARALEGLARYARIKADADTARIAGRVDEALRREARAQTVYNGLPAWARW